MENERKNNKTVIVAIAALAIIGIVAGTYAYFTSSARVDNTFTAASYTTEVQRSLLDSDKLLPGDTINITNLNVKNLGERNISVRAKVTESIVAADGTTALALNSTTNSTTASSYDSADAIVKTLGSDWTSTPDAQGYYYYKGVVAPNSASQNLFTSLLVNTNLKNESSCEYSTNPEASENNPAYQDANTNEFTGGSDTEGRHAGNVKCTSSNSTGYAKSVYTLTVQFDTIQSSAVSAVWTNAPAEAQEAAVTATDSYGRN